MNDFKQLEIPISGMDCAECTHHVQQAIAGLAGVQAVEVFLASEKAVVRLDPRQVELSDIRQAVERAGYRVGSKNSDQPVAMSGMITATRLGRTVLGVLGLVFGVVLFVVVVGEWLGVFERINEIIPWYLSLALILMGGYPVFRKVILATFRRQVVSHTLMTLGVLAACVVGEWATAVVVVFFMRVGDTVEHFTTEKARRAVRDLAAIAPRMARLERAGQEVEVPVEQVGIGEVVIVRPGEMIPIDGEVIAGQATVDQAAITGESMPVEVGPGSPVYATSFARLGSLRVRARKVGSETTFGRVIQLVEEVESKRGPIERYADRFSAYYLPVVAGIGVLTLILRRDPLAAAAVLVVACSCSFALATPVAMLASIGAAARKGILIKGGRYLETLAQAEVLLIDKTGTLTLGKPRIEICQVFENGDSSTTDQELSLLFLVASAEKYSEHPLAEAVRDVAREEGLDLAEPESFEALPGVGVRAIVNSFRVEVGNRRIVDALGDLDETNRRWLDGLEAEGFTLLIVAVDGRLSGVLAARDQLRAEAPGAILELRDLGIQTVELLTGDNNRTAADLAGKLGIPFRAELLPEDKIRIVQEYQAGGRRVVMVGDGVNDAPALAQADVGIAMGAAGSDIAIEAAHLALMRDDWRLVAEAIRISQRTMRVVKGNIAFTALYNLLGLSLAALGYLPPVLAAAAQSLPDLGILANSARLLRQK